MTPRRHRSSIALSLLLLSLAAGAAPSRALQEEAPPAPAPPPPPRVVALGAVAWTSEAPEGQAAALAIEEELPRKLAQAAPETVRVVPIGSLRQAARALAPPVTVVDWGSARSAAEQLACDLLILVEGQTTGQMLSARWQIYDTSNGQGTLGAGQLPGHMIDMDGFVTSLTRRIAEAIGGFDPGRLRTDARVALTESNEAYSEYFLGRALLREGRYAEAAELLNGALARDPNLGAARWHLASATAGLAGALCASGSHAEAIALADPTLREIEGTNLHETQAALLETLESAYAALELGPQAQEAAMARAEALIAMGQARLALAVIEGLLRDGVQHPRLPLAIAAALRLSDDWEAAAGVLQDALAGDPSASPVAYALGDLRLAWSEALAETPEAAETRQALSQAALEALLSAAELSQQSPEVVIRLGEAWLAVGNLGEARGAFTRALEAAGEALPATVRARALASLGRIDLVEGQVDPARARLSEAYALAVALPLAPVAGAAAQPADYAPARLWSNLGHIALDLGDPVLAQRCLLEAEIRHGPQALLAPLRLRLQPPPPEVPPAEEVPADPPPAEPPPAEPPPADGAPEGA